ncbi:hypothetical protein [Halopseudomonas pelagia]|uniref:hypothetical protein n=1 Tax=Halopseudomonas pelagia TaxID=553151 RepID=UPI0030DDA419|tara:strand:- start:101 stop:586 length:486 start_codon:yes stop_codon:yes gene_type:complete
MVEQTDSGRPQGQPEQDAGPPGQDALNEWVELGKQAGATASTFGKLLSAELKLASADVGRLFVVGLALFSLASMAWLGLSVLLSWLAYQQLASVTLALLVFLAIQVLAILVLVKAAKTFKQSLSLPATKRNLRAIVSSAAATKTDDVELKESRDGTQRPSA